tara:strand:- start:371 stop:1051 length:681 start_codon:yes stop_codon:yes gene_type:complete
MRKIFLIFLILTSTSIGSEFKKFLNPRTLLKSELSSFFMDKRISLNNLELKTDVTYNFSDGKNYEFEQKFKIFNENQIKIKIYKLRIKLAEFFSDGQNAKLKRLFKDDKKRTEDNLNLRIFTKRLDLPIRTSELTNILRGIPFNSMELIKIEKNELNGINLIDSNIVSQLNSNMHLVKVIISGKRSAIISYSDYRALGNQAIPFVINVETDKFQMNIKVRSAIIKK